MSERTEVLIAGAGPTGLTLACALTARGIDHVLLDQAERGANTSRAAVIHARTLEVLDGLGISEELVRRGIVVPAFAVRDRDRVLMRVPFGGLPTKFPYTLMLPQDVTEQVLAAHLPAGSVRWGHRVVGFENDAAKVAGPDGSISEIRFRYLAGCDGMHSAVREQTGIGFTGDQYAESFVLADVTMDWPYPRDEVNLFFSPNGLVVVAPLPGDHYRIVATLDSAPEHPTALDVQRLLDDRGPMVSPGRVTGVAWSSRFRVHHRLADHYRQGPVFLAGDAAHVHSPAGGQGMNTGIQDAVALARVLAGDPADLDAYERERRPVAAQVVATAHRMTRAATVRNPLLRAGRNTVLGFAGHVPAVRRRLALNLSELGR
ncbi:FAD-dependent monooxygenase [Paractinoplanes lichenicola]|uniref:FAD-dependent monooxygenase n=1 Tax=Paractinoplanes lichenicola TaxID=2802976 RepID=A0ABS1VLD4_9ACTN|nr:FAD-dependent monooxygenase [Actinoplanes lichenicola]MBL7255532.1 FAD-dependent monooxygenase [Actinoplanes lichenicola]